MRYAIIIPARNGSTRFPGKPLARLRGATGISKTLIQRSWQAASEACDPAHIWVATDDDRIAAEVRKFGGRVAMTPSRCRNGTERCAAALNAIGNDVEIIVNLQGDAPLSPSFLVGQLAALLEDDPTIAMATPALKCSASTYAHLVADADAGRVGGTTVVFNRVNQALYFSKRVLPYIPKGAETSVSQVHLHLGLYAYRRNALVHYASAPPSSLEELEGLEQLRFLDQGLKTQVLPIEPLDWDCIELNNPSDVPVIEAALQARGIE